SYEAISYHWGDQNDTRVVYCEGKPLRVTVSLYTGLKRLRRQDIVRVFWADAVCINQKDTLEKNAQLPLVSRIYSQPSRVLVLLGENTSAPADRTDGGQRLRAEGKPNVLDYNWRRMNSLLCRPWFDRRWIIQEVTLADDTVPRLAICGHVEFSWNDLASVACRIAAYGIPPLLAGLSTST
ncbi:hypothetical protein MYCTH_2058464, partial [Thermothelomyces thermophilus ATCC 42464]